MAVKGMGQLRSQFRALGKVSSPAASVKGAEVIMLASQDNAPVLTGNLRDSHEVVETVWGAEVRVNADYAVSVEFGTSEMAAQPFLRPAIDLRGREVVGAVAEDIQAQIKGAI